jgi:hypothetical protein
MSLLNESIHFFKDTMIGQYTRSLKQRITKPYQNSIETYFNGLFSTDNITDLFLQPTETLVAPKQEEAIAVKIDPPPQIPEEYRRPTFFKPKDPALVQTKLSPSFLQQLQQHEAEAVLAQQQQQQIIEDDDDEEKLNRMKLPDEFGGSTRKKFKKMIKSVKRKTKTKKSKKMIKRKGRKTRKQRK